MTFASLCNGNTNQILPISSVEISGTQSDTLATLHVAVTYSNPSKSPIPIIYSPSLENYYEIRNIKAYSGGISLGPVDKPDYKPTINKSNSMEIGLLDEQETFTSHLGHVQPNGNCQLTFDITVRAKMKAADNCSMSIKLTAPSYGRPADIKEAFVAGVKFILDVDLAFSNAIVEVSSNVGNTNFNPTSPTNGKLYISGVPTLNEIEYSVKMKTVDIDFTRERPRADSNARIYSFGPLRGPEICQRLVDARNASDLSEKACYLAQAAHGYQLSNEELITGIVVHRYPGYDGDILTLSKNTGTEVITAVQPSAWINDRYDSVFSPYEGKYINNYLNTWNGRTFNKFVLHNLLLGVHSIVCFVLLALCIVLWGVLGNKGFAAFLVIILLFYIGLNLFFILRHNNLRARRLNQDISNSICDTLLQLRSSIPPGYIDPVPSRIATAGIFWKEMFFEPGFDVLLRLITSLSRNPTDQLYSSPSAFRSLMLLHRYIVPLIFAFNDEQKMAQFGLIVKSFRKVVVNGLLQGSIEIKQLLEQEIYNSLEDEAIRATRQINMRHFTLDVAGIIELFKSISNAASSRTGEKGEELRSQFSRLNDAIAHAEQNGMISEIRQIVNNTPYLEFFM